MNRAVNEEAEATEVARGNGPFGDRESKLRTESQEDEGAEVKSEEKGAAVLPTRSVLRIPCAFHRHRHPHPQSEGRCYWEVTSGAKATWLGV